MPVPRKFGEQLQAFCQLADHLATVNDANAMLFLMERPTDWAQLREATGEHVVLLAGDTEATLEGAADEDFDTILLDMPSETPVYERLTQSLLEAVAEELLPAGATVVAVYSGFEPEVIDSLSVIRLGEHLGQLTVRDLRQLKTRIPLERYFARDGALRVTLITCGGPFDRTTGHYRDNVVVTAEAVG